MYLVSAIPLKQEHWGVGIIILDVDLVYRIIGFDKVNWYSQLQQAITTRYHQVYIYYVLAFKLKSLTKNVELLVTIYLVLSFLGFSLEIDYMGYGIEA